MGSLSELATEYFYLYDYRLRGYYHFDAPVDLEPSYFPFERPRYQGKAVDDGRVPSVFERIGKLLSPKEEGEDETQELPLEPNLAEQSGARSAFRLTFPEHQEISLPASTALLSLLAYTDHAISFEIIASHESIAVQFTCSESDRLRLQSQIQTHFPSVVLREHDPTDIGLNPNKAITILDLGLEQESARPILQTSNFSLDPLASIIGCMEHLDHNEYALVQIIFQGVRAPWAQTLQYAVSDGQGGSFFADDPDMPRCASEKGASPLFASVMRIAVQSPHPNRDEILAQELVRNCTVASQSEYNRLIALPNKEYDYQDHVLNLFLRQSNRWGMLLNAYELASFVHYPNNTIVSHKLRGQSRKTKEVLQSCRGNKYLLGENEHLGHHTTVSLSDEQRLKHCHVIGATGTGKSTLLTRMVLEDISQENGCAVLDPHGDLIEDIITRIPENRINDVVLIDPADTEYPIGFNMFHAETEAEKIVLSSDLISAFQKNSSSWGDVIHSILSNAINTFLDSDQGGTLLELKRFLVESDFRNKYLKTVNDPTLLYYWKHDYPMLRKGSLAPLLIRLDSFLHSRTVRYMLAQKGGIDFAKALSENKIVLIKLAQGLIGEQNAYLLGSLFLSKIYQVAQGRQNISKEQRKPFYLYIDEFQNFVTESISQTLSGARKYGLGLTLAHQELTQIDDPKVLQSVISNPNIRICFRLSDKDAKRLESDFSYFESSDFSNLDVGQAIVRVGRSHDDFSLLTEVLSSGTEAEAKKRIIEQSRREYAKPRSEVEALLKELLPKAVQEEQPTNTQDKKRIKSVSEKPGKVLKEVSKKDNGEIKSDGSESAKEKLLDTLEKRVQITEHRALQEELKKCGQSCGFLSEIEAEVTGGKVDVSLKRGKEAIAIEVSVSNTPEYEVKNIKKCLNVGYAIVLVVSNNPKHLESIQRAFASDKDSSVLFMNPQEAFDFIRSLKPKQEPTTEVVKGFRVKTSYESDGNDQALSLRKRLAQIIGTTIPKPN